MAFGFAVYASQRRLVAGAFAVWMRRKAAEMAFRFLVRLREGTSAQFVQLVGSTDASLLESKLAEVGQSDASFDQS